MKSIKYLVHLALIIFAGLLVSACSVSRTQPLASQLQNDPPAIPTGTISLGPEHWLSEHFTDHPLVGTVWLGSGQQSSWAALSNALVNSEFVLLGEIHPNRDHHTMQARIVELLAQQGRKPVVIWEMIPEDKQAVLDSPELTTAEAVRALENKLDWASSGWPQWSIYEPIALAAVTHGLPMRGAALDRLFLRKIATSGITDLNPDTISRLQLEEPLSDKSNVSMLDQLYKGHCELMPKSAMAPMQLAQRARDGAMADAMLRNTEITQGAVLIAGNGHVRNDWGVAAVLERSLRQLSSDARILTVAQIEVTEAAAELADYSEIQTDPATYDFIVFTPRSETKDHCAELRKRFKG